ncbi:aldo/keto reductase [Afifella pfennigii]|uniref:aldo/keto reductase n=1 Tax=Afifella pfennigii TaxID=209897 RepID=UPI00047D16C4|nr:aldo/keto reductase [Afifella pfennigii]
MQQRKLGPYTVSAIGLGCMGLSHGYGIAPERKRAERLLNRALERGYTFLDTAAVYGAGANETLIGEVLGKRRDEFVLATKCGLRRDGEGRRVIDGRPTSLKRSCEESLKRLKTEAIDLCYLHRLDKRVPIEDSVGALGELVEAGKVKSIGLSEVSVPTLIRAHAVHPISAVQSEYSLWTRNPEIAMLAACRQLDITFVAFAPLGRAFLTGTLRDPTRLVDDDLRRTMPRFRPENFFLNLDLVDRLVEIAGDVGCSPAQLALAWLLGKGDDIVPIPGTTDEAHLAENAAAVDLQVPPGTFARLDRLINETTVAGERYAPHIQMQLDTEEFGPPPVRL